MKVKCKVACKCFGTTVSEKNSRVLFNKLLKAKIKTWQGLEQSGSHIGMRDHSAATQATCALHANVRKVTRRGT
jgi:hypothetical protein